eukprot:jgi/Chrzof1/2095/Cz11g02170.t1
MHACFLRKRRQLVNGIRGTSDSEVVECATAGYCCTPGVCWQAVPCTRRQRGLSPMLSRELVDLIVVRTARPQPQDTTHTRKLP